MDFNGGGAGEGGNGGEVGTIDDITGGGGGGDAGAGGGEGGDAGAGAGGAGGEGGDAGGGAGGADPDWYAQLSGETGEGESASNLDVVKAKGWKSLDDVVKGYRAAERALRDGGRIKVPGEGASAEEIAEYRKAIGVPEDPKGYAVPEFKDAAGNPIPLNTAMTERITAAAHKMGVPKAALDALLEGEIRAQIEENDAHLAQLTEQANAHVKGWGADREAKMASVNAAAKALGLTKPDMAAMRSALGPAKMLDMLAKAGENYNEDTLIEGDRKSFGMKPEEAQKELDAMKADKAISDKIVVPGTPEHQRYNRLLEIVASAADRATAS